MRAYSMDLRERVLRDGDAGMTSVAVAQKYDVSRAWVDRLKQRRRGTGEVAPRAQRYGPHLKLGPHLHRLVDLIREQPDRTLAELQAALGLSASLATIWRAVKRLGFTVKKPVRASEHDRPDLAAARQQWQAAAPTWDPARLVFLDETGVTTNLLRRYGRGPRGDRVGHHAPLSRWQTSTFIAGLRITGLTAPGVIDGAMDGDSFLAYVEQILVPTLAAGDIVIADNLAAHHVDGVQQLIEPPGRHCGTCPRTVPISIRSNSASRNSQRWCAPRAVARSRRSGRCSASVSLASRQPSAATTSAIAATQELDDHEKRFSVRKCEPSTSLTAWRNACGGVQPSPR
jgi:transposase